MISNKGEEIQAERIFNNLMGILLGPVDLPTFKRFIISETAYGAVGEMKNVLGLFLSRKLRGDFGDLGIVFVTSSATLTKNLLNVFAIVVESVVR